MNTERCADHKWLAGSNVRTCGGCLAAKLAEAEAHGIDMQESYKEQYNRAAELMWKLSDIVHNSSISVPLGVRAEDHYRDQLRRCIAIAAQGLAEASSG